MVLSLSPSLVSQSLAEWTPAYNEACLAEVPIESAFLRSFKDSLTRLQSRSHFVVPQETSHSARQDQRVTRPVDRTYPVSLFNEVPELPDAVLLDQLADNFIVLHQPKLPFLRSIRGCSRSLEARPSRPIFLQLAAACVGSMLSSDRDAASYGESIWHTALQTHTASIEIDQRLGRELDWVFAVSHR